MIDSAERAAARLLLRLAATPSAQVIGHAEAGRAALNTAMQPLFEAARARWVAAAAESARHVALVTSNNPLREFPDILARPDVQQALRDNWQRAADEAVTGLIASWNEGVRLGTEQAIADMRTLGMEVPDALSALEVGQPLYDRLLSDAYTNVNEAGDRMVAAVLASDLTPEGVADAVRAQASNQANRARAGITTAGAEGYQAAQIEMYRQSAQQGGYVVKVMWVTHFRPGTCKTCAALHGQVRTLGAEFDHFAHFGTGNPPKVFGTLQGPPRHPNCGCRLVPYIDAEVEAQAEASVTVDTPPVRTDLDGPTPQTLQQFGEAWYQALVKKIKRLFRLNRRTRR